MGFDFDIHYKEGVSNKAVDALSRRQGAELLPMLLDNAHQDLLTMIKHSWETDPLLRKIISDLQLNKVSHPKFTWIRDDLRRRGKLVIGSDPNVRNIIQKLAT